MQEQQPERICRLCPLDVSGTRGNTHTSDKRVRISRVKDSEVEERCTFQQSTVLPNFLWNY